MAKTEIKFGFLDWKNNPGMETDPCTAAAMLRAAFINHWNTARSPLKNTGPYAICFRAVIRP
jgi:hypothetical protein